MNFSDLLEAAIHAHAVLARSANVADTAARQLALDQARAACIAYVSGLEAERDALTHEYLRQISAARARIAKLESALQKISEHPNNVVYGILQNYARAALAAHDTPGGE